MFWLVGIVVGIAAAIGALRWALRSHREDRRPWLELLDTAGADGIADDASGQIPPIVAPFTGRRCLGYVIEIVVEEQFMNETTFYRAHMDGAGQLLLRGQHVDLRGGRTIFPTPLIEYGKFSSSLTNETVFHGPMQQAPGQLHAFVQSLDPEAQQLIYRPSRQLVGGKRVYFNERIVLPGQSVVVAGREPAALALGTLAGERARVAKLPVAGEAFGAVMAGVIACAAVNAVLAIAFGH